MAAQPIDYSALADQARQSAPVDYAALAQQARQGSDITANTKSEGTYRMVSPDKAGTYVQIPFSNVQTASQQGYKIAGSDNARYLKDSGHPIQALQAGFDNLTSDVTPEERAKVGPVTADIGQGVLTAARTLASPIVHPVDTAKGIIAQGGTTAINAIDLTGTLAHAAGVPNTIEQAKRVVQPVVNDYKTMPADQATSKLAGTLAGIYAGGKVAGAATDAIASSPLGEAVGSAADNVRQYARPKSSPDIVPRETIQAQKIAQSILPPGGIKPELVQSIQAEAPAVKAYAARTGNPLNTQAEGLAAAQGVAKEGLQHFNDKVLAPVASESVNLSPTASDLGPKATLGEISNEITALNKKVNTASAPNSGAVGMLLEKGGVQDQLGYLRGILYDQLSKRTRISPEDLQTLREGYGGQFTMANGLESAQNARLTRTGQASQGVKTIGAPPTSVLDYPSIAYKAARGGEQAIADRQFQSAMQDVSPQEPIRPTANPPATPVQGVRGLQKWANDGALKVVNHIHNDPASGLTANDIQQSARNPQVRQLLIKASDLTPGSPAMNDIVKQIKTTLGAAK